jgi:hypothetical protein
MKLSQNEKFLVCALNPAENGGASAVVILYTIEQPLSKDFHFRELLRIETVH